MENEDNENMINRSNNLNDNQFQGRSHQHNKPMFNDNNRTTNTNNNSYRGRGNNNYKERRYNEQSNYRGRKYGNYRGQENWNIRGGSRYNDKGGGRRYNDNMGSRYNQNYNLPKSSFQNKNQNYNINNDPFYITNKNLILDIMQVFPEFKEKELIIFLKHRSMSCKLTIFEIMNSIVRESRIITHLYNVKNTSREFYSRLQITETPYSNDMIDEQITVLQHYKVHSISNKQMNLPDIFYYTSESEKRRNLERDTDGFYNYIPRIYKQYPGINTNEQNVNIDLYAKNLNEVEYHSLQYKTILCRKKECNLHFCPNAHNMEQDFRLIYEYKKEDICKLMLTLMNNKELLHIEDYLEHFEIPISFNLSNFKIHRCELHSMGNGCPLDSHLCLCYHNEKEERRRPPGLFRYQNERCSYAQPEFGGEYREAYCPYGIFCPRIHSKAELNYHEENFRQVFPCTRKKKKGKCVYYSTCYGIHDCTNDEDNLNNMSEDEGCERFRKELEEEMAKLRKFGCHLCGELPTEINGKRTYCVNKKCGEFLCLKCFKECIKEKPPKCLSCDGEVVKGEMFKVIFKERDEQNDD